MVLKSILGYFWKKEKLAFSLILSEFASYLPWHCLYFLPLPHAPFLSILSLYLVHIVLWLLALFYGHLVHIIISIICIINITNNLFNVDKMWTKSSYILSFVSKKIISYIDCLINVDRLFSVTLKWLWYFIQNKKLDITNFAYLGIS